MKLIVFILLSLAVFSCNNQKTGDKTSNAPLPSLSGKQAKVLLDTARIITLSEVQKKSLNDYQEKENRVAKQLTSERIKLLSDIIASNDIDPEAIDGDSLRLGIEPGKLIILRKRK